MPVPSPFFRKTASTSLLQRKTMFILYWSRTEARWHPPTVQQASSFLQASCQLCLIISSEQMFMFSEEIMRHASSHRRPRSNHHRGLQAPPHSFRKKLLRSFSWRDEGAGHSPQRSWYLYFFRPTFQPLVISRRRGWFMLREDEKQRLLSGATQPGYTVSLEKTQWHSHLNK